MNRPGFLLLLLAAALGCGSKFDPNQYPTPEALFEVSVADFRAGNCGRARVGFQRLLYVLPPSDDRIAEVRFYLAECQLKGHEELEAARNFRRVSDEHPSHPLASDALLRAGDANAKLWRRPELDPSYGEAAVTTYTELLSRYPATAAADSARRRIARLNEMFAQKDFKNGVFYLRLRAFDSAILYFKDVIARYPQSTYAPRAGLRLIEAYGRIGYKEEKEEMCLYLRQYYPDAKGIAAACGVAK